MPEFEHTDEQYDAARAAGHRAFEPRKWVVETFYNTDPDGKWVDYDDWSNSTLHGPFDTQTEADEFMQDFQADDTDVKDMQTRLAKPDEYEHINPIPA